VVSKSTLQSDVVHLCCADEPMQTCRKIVNWRQYLRFPEEVAVPPMARDLIIRLLCDVEQRLGSHGGAAELKVGIKKLMQPWKPYLRS
jgi:hypothetical protein